MRFEVYDEDDDELLGDIDMPLGMADAEKIEMLKQHGLLPQDDEEFSIQEMIEDGEIILFVVDEDDCDVLSLEADLGSVDSTGSEDDSSDENEDDENE